MNVKANGFVGIGTSTPSSALVVTGATAAANTINVGSLANGGYLTFGPNPATSNGIQWGSNELGLYTSQSSGMNFYTNTGSNSKANLTIANSGAVGVGTSSPIAKFDVLQTAGGSNALFSIASSTAGAGTSTALYVNANGNVGIGTTSALTALQVSGKLSLGDSVNATNIASALSGGSLRAFTLIDTSANARIWRYTATTTSQNPAIELIQGTNDNASSTDDTWWDIYTSGVGGPSAESLNFRRRTGGSLTTYLSILNGGNVGIGTSSPLNVLTVQGSVSGATSTTIGNFLVQFRNIAGTASANGVAIVAGTSTGGGAAFMGFYTPNGTSIGGIRQSAAAGVSYDTASDQRIKENIATTTHSLADLLKVGVFDFTFKSDPSHQKQTGYLAQDLYAAFPDAVATNGDNGSTTLAEGAVPWSVDYGRITPLIVKSVQEIATISGVFKDNMIAWFGSAENGITRLFAHEVDTNKLCVNKANGTAVCVTGDQLDALISSAGIPVSQGAIGGTGTGSGSTGGSSGSGAGSTTADTEAPTMAVIGGTTINVDVGAAYTDAGATVSDNVDSSLSYTMSLDGAAAVAPSEFTLDTAVAGTHSIEYKAIDAAGNVGVVTRTVVIQAPPATVTAPPPPPASPAPVTAGTTTGN